MKAASTTLHSALEAVTGDRNKSYGNPLEDFTTQAEMFSAYLTRTNSRRVYVTATDIAALMILVKLARQAHRPKQDNWTDAAGYAACGAECDAQLAEEHAGHE
jgi:hypothetical protein